MSIATVNRPSKETAPSTKKDIKPYLLSPKRKGTIRKYKAIQARMKEMYNKERKRYDDCVAQLMEEFYIEHSTTIYRILATEIT